MNCIWLNVGLSTYADNPWVHPLSCFVALDLSHDEDRHVNEHLVLVDSGRFLMRCTYLGDKT